MDKSATIRSCGLAVGWRAPGDFLRFCAGCCECETVNPTRASGQRSPAPAARPSPSPFFPHPPPTPPIRLHLRPRPRLRLRFSLKEKPTPALAIPHRQALEQQAAYQGIRPGKTAVGSSRPHRGRSRLIRLCRKGLIELCNRNGEGGHRASTSARRGVAERIPEPSSRGSKRRINPRGDNVPRPDD
jgi:hypothetical protein